MGSIILMGPFQLGVFYELFSRKKSLIVSRMGQNDFCNKWREKKKKKTTVIILLNEYFSSKTDLRK